MVDDDTDEDRVSQDDNKEGQVYESCVASNKDSNVRRSVKSLAGTMHDGLSVRVNLDRVEHHILGKDRLNDFKDF